MEEKSKDQPMRVFTSGATRSSDFSKIDYEGVMHPVVLRVYGEYMTRHRVQADGKVRDSDNWQKGIPTDQLMKSLLRHTMEAWEMHRNCGNLGADSDAKMLEALCAVIFNAMGYIHALKVLHPVRQVSESPLGGSGGVSSFGPLGGSGGVSSFGGKYGGPGYGAVGPGVPKFNNFTRFDREPTDE